MTLPDAALLLRGLDDQARATVRRCAVVTSFDKALYEGVLRASGGPELTDLVAYGCVEENRGWGGFQVPRQLRDAVWTSWWPATGPALATRQVPAPMRELAVRVAEWRDTPPEEELRALVLADPDSAADLFERVYRERDAVLNYPGCQDLLDVLSRPELLPLLSPRLVELRNERDRFLKARLFWHPSMLATARYLPRPEVEARLTGLIGGDGPRALRMHATGGMGKSTVAHRFIAWNCVERRVPCALVDLDSTTFDAVVAVRYPWLVMLEFAAQLNLQIDGAPYQEILREYAVYRAMLLPATGDAARSSSAATTDPVALERYGRDVVERFQAVTATLPRPVLLVVDTLEEATLSYPHAEPLMRMLAGLRDTAPQVRLVLAGRGTSSEARMPGLRDLFPDDRADLVIQPFTDEEAVRFLTEIRGIRDEAFIAAVTGRAAGSPWLLGMYADVAAYRTTDPKLVAGYDPFLAWCIDRVVARLDPTLQWMVRYGVVPRRLDRDFAERVVHPRLVEGMTGSPHDRPDQDKRPPHTEPLFPTGAPPEQAFAEIWDHLVRYVSGSSWAKPWPDRRIVRFDDALSGPMRRMLAPQPVSRMLHQAAIEYFQATGDRREELYHWFQLDPAGWPARWRQAVDDCWSRRDIDGALALTEDALAADYAGEPDPFGERTGPAVDEGSRARAYVEQAWALTAQGRRDNRGPGDPLWVRVNRAVRLVTGRPERWLAAHATCLLMGGQYAEALAVLDRGPDPGDGETDPAVRTELALVRAEALVGVGRPAEAAPIVNRVVAEVEPDQVFRWTVVRAVTLAATLACRQGRIAEACELVERAPRREAIELRPLLVRLTIEAGAPERALSMMVGNLEDLEIEALLLDGETEAALDLAQRAVRWAFADGFAAQRAGRLTLLARCSAAYLDHVGVVESLDQAFAIWMSMQDTRAAALTAVTKVGLLLDTSGDLRAAQAYLEESERLQPDPSGVNLGRHAIAAARLAAARGNRTAAYAICVRALDVLAGEDEDVVLRAEVAVLALAMSSPGDTEAAAEAVTGLLRRIEPFAVRMRLLAGLRYGGRPVLAARRWLWDAPADEPEPAVLRWAAEANLAAGDVDTATELAARAAGRIDGFHSRWRLVEFLSRAGRMDLAPPLSPPPDWPGVRDAYLVVHHEHSAPSADLIDRLNVDGITRWAARAQLARSRMLRELGRDDDARDAAYRARAIYADLGDPRENDPELAAHAADARGATQAAANVVDVHVVPGEPRVRPADLTRIAQLPDPLVRLDVEAEVAPEAVELTVPWPANARAVYRAPERSTRDKAEARLIQYALTVAGLSPGPIDGRFGARTRRTLAEFQNDSVPPPDGEAGPRTWAALTEALRARPARRPGLLTVERDVEDSMVAQRGVTHSGASVSFLFTSLAWTHGTLDLFEPRIPPVDLLYVNGSMESSGQVPVISARSQTYGYEAPWRAASPADMLTVTAFDRFLKQAAIVNGLAPLIVLDVSLPGSASEADRQIRLRNGFAHQLMTMGHALTILATGSGTGATQDGLAALLDDAARTGATARDLLVRAREEQAYRAAVALFSAAPIGSFPVMATTRVRSD
jgi:tetratricopeptide (TPR) repeat protein